jgi:hypothetical protein
MSTRSEIGVTLPNGKIKGVYCHFDGYPSGVGNTLQLYYTKAKAKRLVGLGDISTLESDIGKKHDFDDRGPGTTFYGRDRGEEGCDAKYFDTKEEFVEYFDNDYAYLMDAAGVWHVSEGNSNEWKRLDEVLEAENELNS